MSSAGGLLASQEEAVVLAQSKSSYVAAVQEQLANLPADDQLKMQIASDIHLEFYDDEPKSILDFVEPIAPVLALLGDIGLVYHQGHRAKYCDFLNSACEHFEVVLLLAGNHEYYSSHKPDVVTVRTMQEIKHTLRAMCIEVSDKAARGKVVFLDDDALTISGVRVVGSTLWSYVPPEYLEAVQKRVNDYKHIKVQGGNREERPLIVDDTNTLHAQAMDFITREVAVNSPVVVLTHHAPTFEIPGEDAKCSVRHAMCTDLHCFLEMHRQTIAGWVFGHTHVSCVKEISGVKVVSNQHGYPKPHEGEPNTFYNRRFTLRIKA